MLSIYLLLQKNTTKLENLLLIGYGPRRVSFPYQALTVTLNVVVLALSVGVVMWIRTCYLDVVEQLFPSATGASVWPMLVVGVLLFVAVSFFNVVAIRRKVDSIWMHKRKKTMRRRTNRRRCCSCIVFIHFLKLRIMECNCKNGKFWIGLGLGAVPGVVASCLAHTEKAKQLKQKASCMAQQMAEKAGEWMTDAKKCQDAPAAES